jgi:hypothetical protein
VDKYGTAGQVTDDRKIRRVSFTYWKTKDTDIHSEYVTLIAFPRQQLLRERALMLPLKYLACLAVV